MSRNFWIATTAIFMAFGFYEAALNLANSRLPVATFGVCEKGEQPKFKERIAFFIPAGAPKVSQSTQAWE